MKLLFLGVERRCKLYKAAGLKKNAEQAKTCDDFGRKPQKGCSLISHELFQDYNLKFMGKTQKEESVEWTSGQDPPETKQSDNGYSAKSVWSTHQGCQCLYNQPLHSSLFPLLCPQLELLHLGSITMQGPIKPAFLTGLWVLISGNYSNILVQFPSFIK